MRVWAPSPRPFPVPPREQMGALAQPRLFAWGLVLKPAFLQQKQLFPVVMCLLENHLSIAYLLVKLKLSFSFFSWLSVYVCGIYI